jgi:hypothetical protein
LIVEGSILCENSKFQNNNFFCHSGPNILGPTRKLKILLPTLFSPDPKVSKKVCHTPVGQKLREEIDFSRNGPFLAQGCTLEAG